MRECVCETARGSSPQGVEYLEEFKVEENFEEAELRSLCFVQILLTQ